MAATMRTGSRSLFAVSVLAVVLLGACSSSKDNSYSGKSTSGTTASTATPPSTIQAAGVSAIVRGEQAATDGIEVEIDDNYFKPNILTGSAGKTVTLELSSEGKSIHNFSVTEQRISTDVEAGKKASVKVTFPASG